MPGRGMKTRRPLIAALPVRFLRGPERIVDRDAEREERKDKREETREGGEKGLGVRPALGPQRPKRPALRARLGRLRDRAARIWGA